MHAVGRTGAVERMTVPASWSMGWEFAVWTVLSALGIYVLLLVFSRLVGPRSFSQMTAFDFAVTVALGAIVGSTAAGAVGLPAGLLALASLFTFRGTVAYFRRYGLDRLVDNRPVLLMWEGRTSSPTSDAWTGSVARFSRGSERPVGGSGRR